MTIVMVGHKGLPARSGGIERHVEELSAALVRLGVRVISFDRKWYVENEPAPHGVERRWSVGISTKNLDAITHTFTAILRARREKPDIIHIHGVGPSLLLPFARLLHPHTRLISTFHTIDRVSEKWSPFARFMLWLGEWMSCTFAHRTIVVSDALHAYCLDTYGRETITIPNGVRMPALESFKEDAVRHADAAVLERLKLAPKRYFLMATRLVVHKNVHVAMEAHRLFAERRPYLAAQFPLVIAGGSAWTDGYERELRTRAISLPLVSLVGERHGEELEALQRNAACHVSVAASEGMSIALLEALSYARPVIVSDIPPNTEVTGTLATRVPAGDAQALSEAMECAAMLTDKERDDAGVRLRQRVLMRHDWNDIAKLTLNVYEDALDKARVTERQAVA